jgi:intracellular sulfur oxidation DsrE/DsrF family protein
MVIIIIDFCNSVEHLEYMEITSKVCEILISRSSADEHSSVLGCDAMQISVYAVTKLKMQNFLII